MDPPATVGREVSRFSQPTKTTTRRCTRNKATTAPGKCSSRKLHERKWF